MNFIELEELAAKCFKDFNTYYKERTAFIEDYQFFEMYMKRNTKSSVKFIPQTYSRALQSVIDDYPHDERGLERAFCISCIARQIILDLQDWNTPVFSKGERNKTLKYMIDNQIVDIDIFCTEFISCSSAHSEIVNKIGEIYDCE